MSARLNPIEVADDIFEFHVPTSQAAQTLAQQLRQNAYVEDVVAGLDRVCVSFDPVNYDALKASLSDSIVDNCEAKPNLPLLEITVAYGDENGPDFDRVCSLLGLTPQAFIEQHTRLTHTVDMIGFIPGFAYMSGMPSGAEIPRLSTPRARVPAGSVGLSGAYTGIYALAGPGGWPLIGRTMTSLFDAAADQPMRLAPGQCVRFKAA